MLTTLAVVDPLASVHHLPLSADQQAAGVVALLEEDSARELDRVRNGGSVDVGLVLAGIQVQDVGLTLLRILLTDDDTKLGFFQVQGHAFLRVVVEVRTIALSERLGKGIPGRGGRGI